ncbi:hypothetical protein JCM31447_321200 [Fluviispira sanaruensis]|uniref:Tail specific protease domain-containing protein n=2 Tax=Fluviispira sanaruensis TaxID=2493639 RepID=A0A4V0P2D3_FLUSA|nr:hypothetical protein JCM31447_321200 [Fluviispira sanaruensis]
MLVALNAIVFLSACNKSENTAQVSSYTDEPWELPKLNAEEKTSLVDSVQTVFREYYVNDFQKNKESYYDPYTETLKLNKEMDSETLLREAMKIFNKNGDIYTNFTYPSPAKCLSAHFYFDVAFAYDNPKDKEGKLVISKKYSIDTVPLSREEKNDFYNIQVGDELLSIANIGIEGETDEEISAVEGLKLLMKQASGRTDEVKKDQALQRYFLREGDEGKTPEGNFTVKIKRRAEGQIVTYTFPWMRYLNYKCSKKNEVSRIIDKNNLGDKKANIDPKLKPAYLPGGSANIVEYAGKSFAVIRVSKFVKDKENEIDEVERIKDFLEKERNKIDGVIFDLRGDYNFNNYFSYATSPVALASLFTTQDISYPNVILRVSDTNRETLANKLFINLKEVDNLDAFVFEKMGKYLNDEKYKEQIKNRSLFTNPFNIFDANHDDRYPKDPNAILYKGILTDKLIAVFANSDCSYACNTFVSLMKDYKIAKIYGTSKQIGGREINIFSWNDFAGTIITPRGTTKSIIPNAKILPKGSDISFAWGQTVRENARAGNEQYLGGNGVLVDTVYLETRDDIINNDRNIFNKIFADMADPKNSTGFYLNRP